MTIETKISLKEKIKTGIATLGSIAALGVVVFGGTYLSATYERPIRTITKPIPGCTIVSIPCSSEVPEVTCLTPEGRLETVGISPLLEYEVSKKIVVERKTIPATLESHTTFYRTCWGYGPISSRYKVYLKSLEREAESSTKPIGGKTK